MDFKKFNLIGELFARNELCFYKRASSSLFVIHCPTLFSCVLRVQRSARNVANLSSYLFSHTLSKCAMELLMKKSLRTRVQDKGRRPMLKSQNSQESNT